MLKDKVAIVTGGTRGIGRAIALKLADHGANIVINYRNSDKEAEELKAILEEKGVKVLTVKCDISNFEDSKNIMDKCKEVFGKIDILVNNAGITKDTLIMRMKEEDFDNVIDVNLKGTFNCAKHASAIMLKQRFGKIINMTSVVGIAGNAGQVNYAASKSGVIGLTKSLAKELGSRGITVNAVAPGFINTDMTASLSEKVKEEASKNIPLKRLGDPEDVANLVGFLASDAANYITGQVINVDGGMVM
ncbi:3-oxoacyl-[acyl-carrier-protein] reductase [Clostridium perfringens]|jgi:3-oxoacyl-[acyl-carrier protein] reductase|uniref:3-oxoacyl-[acyl-carrier-protein] reductase n=1 Tax=Clostridium perfringens TaxID=1502 RepID=A0A6G4ZBU8_CLOPF|nr:3-oxoacyl-[acyl-carrier-protein] reductase [Clostridium perfringens]EIF6288383.1 3-oxoacyl-[acyl-carrier-protein] reductase [Clostridium perfringens]EJT5930602.1 3-oxoacyl-[acyl-carrier-protein] reductase [Clostridium perfringens]EJT6161864.1 3-oxoacyl-[acyl-carrier-protein] reductase [Clostridium perfringens]EJT6475841.1 3-oxoacyl-[acyl-carrier-protein] reductase [Clostridium perfringens]EJT6504346.1 3-oxoacyl-[acyl-carrier-protein] reductase [Clostridium perfringens]